MNGTENESVTERVCSKCGNSYPFTAEYFIKNNSVKSGLGTYCRKCKSEIDKKYREENKERLCERHKQYYAEHKEERKEYFENYKRENREKYLEQKHKDYEKHKEKRLEACKKYAENHKDEIRIKGKRYREEHKEEISERGKQYRAENSVRIKNQHAKRYQEKKQQILDNCKRYRENNREAIKEQKAKYYQENKEQINEKRKAYCKDNRDRLNEYYRNYHAKRINDPIYRLSNQARGVINDSFRHRGYRKDTKAAELTGLSSSELTDYLLETFKNVYGVKWDGIESVHIDHIIPLATAENIDDIKRLCHYSNLQLIKAKDNLKKNCKLDYVITA